MVRNQQLLFLAILTVINLYWVSFQVTSQPEKRNQDDLVNTSSSVVVTKNVSQHKMIIMILSGAGLREARDRQRTICAPLYKAAGIPYYFVVGVPSFDDRDVNAHPSGELATEMERNVSNMLLDEHEVYADIVVTPNRDHYRDLNEKALGVLRFALEQGADYIVKIDDEYCANLDVLKAVVQYHESQQVLSELYAGYHYFNGSEYEEMKGPNGEVEAYMGGAVYILSRNLSKTIVGPDWTQNVLRASYGTSSEDANLGKMVARAKELHNMTVNVVEAGNLKLCAIGRPGLTEDDMRRRCYKKRELK